MSDYGKMMRNIGECMEACREYPLDGISGLIEDVASGKVFAVSYDLVASDGTREKAYAYDFEKVAYTLSPADYKEHAEKLKQEFMCMGLFDPIFDEYEN